MGTFLDSAICKNNTLCCCHGRQLFVEDHPHHALHPASNSLARLSSLVRLASSAAAFSDLNVAHYSIFRKKSSYSSSPRLDPDPYTRIARIICNLEKKLIYFLMKWNISKVKFGYMYFIIMYSSYYFVNWFLSRCKLFIIMDGNLLAATKLSPGEPRRAQKSPEEPRGAQVSPEKPRSAQCSKTLQNRQIWYLEIEPRVVKLF